MTSHTETNDSIQEKYHFPKERLPNILKGILK